MADLSDFTPEQLKEYLKWAKGETGASEAMDTASKDIADRNAELASQANKPIAKLGDVISPEDLKAPAVKAREAAAEKLTNAAKGSVGEGVISNTPPLRRFEAIEKLSRAAKGTVGDDLITNVPSSSGFERMASPEELAQLPTNKATSVAQKAMSEINPSSASSAMQAAVDSTPKSWLDNLASRLPVEKIKELFSHKIEAPTMAEAAEDLGSAVKSNRFLGVSGVDTAKLASGASKGALAGGDAALSGLGKLGMSAGRLALSTPVAATSAFLDPTPISVGPGEDSEESVSKRLRERLSPEEQAAIDKFAQGLAAKKAAGMLPYQQATQQETPVEPVDEETPPSSGLGSGLPSKAAATAPGRTPAVSTAPTNPEASIMQQFAQAQHGANEGILNAQLGKAGSLIGSGITATQGVVKPTELHDKIFDTNIAVAQQIPEQFKQKMEMARLDPNSDVSVSSREFIKKTLNIDIPANVSAQQLKEQFPVVEKLLQARESAAMRKLIAEENAKTRNSSQDLNRAIRSEGLRERTINAIEKDPVVQRTIQRKQSLQRGLQMLQSGEPISPEIFKDIMREMAAGMTGTTTVAQSFVKDTDIQTAKIMMDKYKQKFTGKIQDLRKSSPEVLDYVTRIMSQMNKGFEADEVIRKADLAETRLKSTDNDHVKRALNVYVDAKKQYGDAHQKPAQTSTSSAKTAPASNEERRKTKDGRIAVFDRNSKKFLRYE